MFVPYYYRLSFKELGYVDDDGEKQAGEDVVQRSVLLLLQSVVWPENWCGLRIGEVYELVWSEHW